MIPTKELTADAAALLRQMIRIPSPSFKEEEVAALIRKTLESWGLRCSDFKGNIIGFPYDWDPSRKTLAFDAHMDTVAPNSGYTRDPYEPGEDEDTIWGLGANDDGASVVSMASALRRFIGKELPFNLMLIVSREEECSGPDGTSWLFSEDGPFKDSSLPRPDWVVIGEPTGMQAATSERGLLVIDGYAHGVSGHAARGEGINALYIALDDINRLKSYSFDKKSEVMGEVKLNVTMIESGTAHNVIPDLCHFVVDIRPTEKYSNEEILANLQAICQSELKARNLRNSSNVTPVDSALMDCIKTLGIPTYSSPTTSDWVRIKGDSVKMGPGDSSRSHKADEYIKVSEISDAIDKYTEFIENFNGNTLE